MYQALSACLDPEPWFDYDTESVQWLKKEVGQGEVRVSRRKGPKDLPENTEIMRGRLDL